MTVSQLKRATTPLQAPQLPLVSAIRAFIAKQVLQVLPSSLAYQEPIEVSMVVRLAATVGPALLVAIAPPPVLLRYFVLVATTALVVSRSQSRVTPVPMVTWLA